jgi:phasin family protein
MAITQTPGAEAVKAADDAGAKAAETGAQTAKAAASDTAKTAKAAAAQAGKTASNTKVRPSTKTAKAANRKPSPPRKFTGDSSMATAKKEAEKTVETFAAASNEAMKDGFEKSIAALNDMSAFQRDSIDAVIASATTASKSLEELNARAVDYTRKSLEDGMATARSLASAKSVQEVVEIHADYTKSAMEAWLAEVNRTSDLMSSMMKDTFKPLNDRFAAAVEMAQSQR